jgi:myosin-crossreactive antigen
MSASLARCVFRADAIWEFQLRPGRGSQQKVRSCKAPILGTALDRLSGIIYLVLDGRIVKNNIHVLSRGHVCCVVDTKL